MVVQIYLTHSKEMFSTLLTLIQKETNWCIWNSSLSTLKILKRKLEFNRKMSNLLGMGSKQINSENIILSTNENHFNIKQKILFYLDGERSFNILQNLLINEVNFNSTKLYGILEEKNYSWLNSVEFDYQIKNIEADQLVVDKSTGMKFIVK